MQDSKTCLNAQFYLVGLVIKICCVKCSCLTLLINVHPTNLTSCIYPDLCPFLGYWHDEDLFEHIWKNWRCKSVRRTLWSVEECLYSWRCWPRKSTSIKLCKSCHWKERWCHMMKFVSHDRLWNSNQHLDMALSLLTYRAKW